MTPGSLDGLRAPWAMVGALVWTGDDVCCQAVAFGADGRVLAVGSDADVIAALPAGAEVVDGRGATVCPGFVDPHVHVRAAASASLGIDVSRTPDLVAAVRDACRGRSGWVTMVGADITRRAPDRGAIDRVSGATPVRIRDRSGHGWLFNSAGLRALRLDPAAAPSTGLVPDHSGWVGARLGRISDRRSLTDAVQRWSRRLARDGVVALCDATATNGPSQVRSLVRWRETGALMQEVTYLAAPDARIELQDRRRCAGRKFADAADPRLPVALRRGQPIAVHALAPEETAAVLTAAAGRRAPRLRIEHAAFVPPDWIDQVRAVGATVVTHPALVEAHGDAYLADEALRPHDWLYRLRSWTRGGVPLAFAGDAPFGPAAPLDALRAAAHRRTASGAVIGADEALVGDEAMRAMTVTAADCAGLGRLGYGRLRPGGPGAAVVLSGDPRRAEQLDDLRLVATVIGGDVVA